MKKKKAKKSEDEPDFEKLSKSVSEELEENEDAKQVLDAVPFMKALVDQIEDQVDEVATETDGAAAEESN